MYFDVIPYDILIIIVSKLKKLEFNNFITAINKDVITDNFYKDLIITTISIIPKRNYNWENIYRGLLDVFDLGFTLNDIKRVEYDVKNKYKKERCTDIDNIIQKNLSLTIKDQKYKEKYCDNLVNTLTFKQSYNENYELLSFLIFENIYKENMYTYIKAEQILLSNYADYYTLSKMYNYIISFLKPTDDIINSIKKIINAFVKLLSTGNFTVDTYNLYSQLFKRFLDVYVYIGGMINGYDISTMIRLFEHNFKDKKYLDLYIYLFDKLDQTKKLEYIYEIDIFDILIEILNHYNYKIDLSSIENILSNLPRTEQMKFYKYIYNNYKLNVDDMDLLFKKMMLNADPDFNDNFINSFNNILITHYKKRNEISNLI
jgi:hypothetical protein